MASEKKALGVDLCSIYIVDQESGVLVLMASDGLKPEGVGSVRLLLGVDLSYPPNTVLVGDEISCHASNGLCSILVITVPGQY